jgi:hypothetical protein
VFVVDAPLFGIFEDFPGFIELLEFIGRFGIVGMFVGMALKSALFVGATERGLIDVGSDPEDVVELGIDNHLPRVLDHMSEWGKEGRREEGINHQGEGEESWDGRRKMDNGGEGDMAGHRRCATF